MVPPSIKRADKSLIIQVGPQQLDGYLHAEGVIALGKKDGAHAALAQQALQSIGADGHAAIVGLQLGKGPATIVFPNGRGALTAPSGGFDGMRQFSRSAAGIDHIGTF